ncbi:hypothetical protein AXG93_1200s1030 [Marchantia polymorpha subsp. ruderalis]|uniref:Plant heme peroxidase family profile domain-containing protein n=1 Tax=Marchantia polymorpha subsp. ruderalis TaxID=1480154 RepID=A0A176WKT5_MARPO|nr:hypothetical protein AXG93_1200s1030 [Marchantia polymorpha subsp. ruderalis]
MTLFVIIVVCIQLNGTGWVVEGGRKDVIVSSAAAAENDLLLPTFDVSELIDSFAKRGLSTEQMVVLSERIAPGEDPNEMPGVEHQPECPRKTFSDTIEIFMDIITPGQFDAKYYGDLTRHNSLFTSDQSLFEDGRTQKLVEALISDRLFGERMRTGDSRSENKRPGLQELPQGEREINRLPKDSFLIQVLWNLNNDKRIFLAQLKSKKKVL